MTTQIVLIVIAMIVAITLYLRYAKKMDEDKKERDAENAIAYAKYRADVAANPQNYFVSEGGTKPDPIPEDENSENSN